MHSIFQGSLLTIICFTFSITGCSGSSSSSDKEATSLIGYWKGVDTENPNSLSKIEATQTLLYQDDEAHECTSFFEFESTLSPSTYTIYTSGRPIDLSYSSSDGGTVSITNSSEETYTLTPATDVEIANLEAGLCTDNSLSGALSISIAFEQLKPYLTIAAIEDFSYGVNVLFDLDGSNSRTNGDIWISHQLNLEDTTQRETYDLTKKAPIAFTRYADDDYSISATGRASIIDNHLSLTFDRSRHSLFSNITNATPIAISAYLWQEVGNDAHEDRDTYPNEIDDNRPIYTNGIDTSLMQDTVEDTSAPESSVLSQYGVSLDIKTIEITITD